MLSRRAKWISSIFVLATISAAALLLRYLIVPRVQRRHIESAIGAFESQPSQANADILVELLDNQEATQEQAKRIISLLFTPKVTTRKAYPLGERPMISAERRFYLRFNHMMVPREHQVWVNNEDQYGGSSSGGNSFDTRPQFFVLHPESSIPGKYQVEIRYKYSFIAWSKNAWTWNPLRGRFPWSLLPRRTLVEIPADQRVKPQYETELAVPVEVVVVEKEKAEQVECVSNPELDEAMRAAFTYKKANMGGSYSTPAGEREYTGSIQVFYKDIPVAAVFKCAYEFPDGREVVEQSGTEEPTRLRAGTSGSFHVWVRRFVLDEPGRYSGTIILRPDLEEAYKDPAIKSIWNGELRFPISFAVEATQ